MGGVMALYMGFRHAAFSVASPVSAVAAAGLSVLVGPCLFLATHRGLLAVTAVIYSLCAAGTIILAQVRSDECLTKPGMFGLCLAAASVSLIAAGAVR